MPTCSDALCALLAAVLDVLNAHGLNQTCEAKPQWAGDATQQATLASLHRALCEYLPPLPGAN